MSGLDDVEMRLRQRAYETDIEAADAIASLRAMILALDRVAEFAEHDESCRAHHDAPWTDQGCECSCGLDAARAAVASASP